MIFSLLPLFAHADDTEIYTGNAARINPNVIFIMDTSLSMEWVTYEDKKYPSSGEESRLDLVKKAAIETINNTDGINISLMRFNKENPGSGGYVDLPMTPVSEARTTFASVLNGYKGNGGTPISETLDESLRYLRGDTIDYGKGLHCTGPWWDETCTETYYSHSGSRNGNKYKSPIIDQCQKNHIVLFSDGVASNDNGSNSYIQKLLTTVPTENRINGLSTSCTGDGGCAEEIAFYGNQEDLSDDFDGIQNVTFHTIGGFIQGSAQTKLENIAKYGSWAAAGKPVNPLTQEGKGIYRNVQNYEELQTTLQNIFDSISKSAGTFTAPAVSVNAFNSLEHLDELYYSVFKPTDSAGWSGNLKRYRLTSDGTIEDAKEQPAVDPATGFFNDSAISFWTLGEEPDGKEVRKGGAASRFTTDRNVVTYLGANKNLTNNVNKVKESNTLLTNLLSVPSSYNAADITNLIKWARGIDVKDEDSDGDKEDARVFMEDPLHSQPVVITYGKDNTTKTFDSTIFLATNSGFLHAFSNNKANPKEHFAFIPKKLLPNLYQYYSGLSSFDKVYGLDGPMSYWHNDVNRNGVILDSKSDIETGEHIYLYTGMRRGGRSYYALDVSDRDKPKYLWEIDNTKQGFSKLGQTWSKMTPASVNWKGVDTKVLFFGGGYDPAEDDKTTRSSSSMGNAIFMVKAKTGELLWSSSNSGANLRLDKMKNSIVADIVPIDSTGDGFTNILYTADVGGRVWRIDLDNKAKDEASFAKGGVIADLNGDTQSTNIRFFNTPDVAYTRTGGISAHGQFQISIGSGYRAHPLDTLVIDRFYVMNDFDVYKKPTIYSNYKESDLANNQTFDTASDEEKKAGIYYKLTDTGEKVLSNSITVANNIFFTTYRPVNSTSAANCDADTGSTRLYQIKPIEVLAPGDDPIERNLGITDLKQGGIPPNPVVLFPPTPVPQDDDDDDDDDECTGDDCPVPCEGPDCENSCEQLSAITAIGAEVLSTNITRCDQLSKSYWRIN